MSERMERRRVWGYGGPGEVWGDGRDGREGYVVEDAVTQLKAAQHNREH